MRRFVILLFGVLIYLSSNFTWAQQESATTATSINQKLLEIKAARGEGLISEAEYKNKKSLLEARLKKITQTEPLKETNNKAILNTAEPNIHPQQSSFILDNVSPTKPTDLNIKQVEVTPPNKVEITSPAKPVIQPAEIKPPPSPIVVPPNPKAIEWNDKSLASANRGEWADAIRTASVAISIDSKFALAYINRCRAYLGHGDIDEAIQDCDAALKLDPQSMLAINNRGAILASQGKQNDALVEYERACFGGLELGCDNFRKIRGYSPKDTATIAKIKLGESQSKFANKNWEGAIASATEVINIEPNNVAAYVTRSGAYANSGHLPEGLADAETAIRLNPDEGLGFNNRGYVYELMKKPRQASLDYEIACGLKAEIGCINIKRIKQ